MCRNSEFAKWLTASKYGSIGSKLKRFTAAMYPSENEKKKKKVFSRDCNRRNLHILNDNNLCCLQSKAIIDNCLQHSVRANHCSLDVFVSAFPLLIVIVYTFLIFSSSNTTNPTCAQTRMENVFFFVLHCSCLDISQNGHMRTTSISFIVNGQRKGSLPRAHTQHEHTMN